MKHNLFNTYKIWNLNKNKIIKIKNIIFNESSCYNFININLDEIHQ